MTGFNRIFHFRWLMFMVLSITGLNLSAADVSLKLRPGSIYLNESFEIMFESSSTVDGEPDFSPLQRDFQILGKSSGRNMSIINGKISHIQQWRLSLMAKSAGQLTIPAIRFGRDKSREAQIQVKAARDSAQGDSQRDIFIEVEVDNRSPYIQQQVLYTLRVYRAVNWNNATLSAPEVDGGDALIEPFGEEQQSEIWKEQRRYLVIQRQFLISPQSVGDLTIKPLQMEAQLLSNQRSSIFNFNRSGRTVRRQSEALTLKVRPVPREFTGTTWLPARSLSLSESWSQGTTELVTGEPVTRSLSIRAEGLSGVQLPELNQLLPEGLKSYPDQPVFEDQNGTGHRLDKTAIIPSFAGSYEIPAIRLSWWNTETDQQQFSEIPGRMLTVVAAAGQQNSLSMSDDSMPKAADITADQTPQQSPVIEITHTPVWLYALLIFCSAGWAITLFFWWRSRQPREPIEKAGGDISLKQSMAVIDKQLSVACAQNDAARVKDLLLKWAALRWPDLAVSNLAAIARRVEGEFATDLALLERALYSRQTDEWKSQDLFQHYKQQSADRIEQSRKTVAQLEPLHRIG